MTEIKNLRLILGDELTFKDGYIRYVDSDEVKAGFVKIDLSKLVRIRRLIKTGSYMQWKVIWGDILLDKQNLENNGLIKKKKTKHQKKAKTMKTKTKG